LAVVQVHVGKPAKNPSSLPAAFSRTSSRLASQRGTGGDLDTRLRAIRQALKVRNGHLPEGHPERLPGC